MLSQFFDGKKLNMSINPDEAVAFGAAVQAAVLTGKQKNVLLIDVTPLSLGIETVGGVMAKVLPRNTTIPTKKSDIFSTTEDGQTEVNISVFEGERPMTKDNNKLGEFLLTGVFPAPRGQAKIDVTFELDANGIMNVSARDQTTGKSNNIVIKNETGRLSEEQIQKMLEDAEKMKKVDEENMKKIASKNELETYLYDLMNSVPNLQASKEKIASLEKIIEQSFEWMEKNAETLTSQDYVKRKKTVEGVILPIISEMYSGQSSSKTSSKKK